jgi:membrane protease YdiL (CAAX protease family)
MEAKKFFLALFVLSVVSFFPLLYFLHDTYLYEAPLHLGMFSLAMYFLWKKDLGTTLGSLGIPGNIKKNALYTVLGFALIFMVLPVLAAVLYYYGLDDQEIVAGIVMELPLYILAMAIVVAPVSEELLFRALLITRIREYSRSAVLAIILASAVFAVFHAGYGSVVQFVGVFVVGLILGFIYWGSGSVIPSMIIHFVYNFMSIMVMRGFL